jgi:hypothetical protein
MYVHKVVFFGGGGQRPLVLLSSSSALHFVPIILFCVYPLLTGMTGISLHMFLLLTSQSQNRYVREVIAETFGKKLAFF